MDASRAWSTRPSLIALVMRASHSSRNAVIRFSRDSWSDLARARPSSSRMTVREAATTARSSRRRYSLPCGLGHRGPVLPVGQLDDRQQLLGHGQEGVVGGGRLARHLGRGFCASMAWRTAGRPPRSSCSATGICSGRRVANMALRCTVDVGAVGRSPRAGTVAVTGTSRRPCRGAPPPGPGPGPPAFARTTLRLRDLHAPLRRPLDHRSAPPGPPLPARAGTGTVAPRAPAPLRPLRFKFSSPSSLVAPAPLARRRGPGSRPHRVPASGCPCTSMRPSVFSGELLALAAAQGEDLNALKPDLHLGPQHGTPRLGPRAPGQPSTTPLGWRAPAARQVQDPSPTLARQLNIYPA